MRSSSPSRPRPAAWFLEERRVDEQTRSAFASELGEEHFAAAVVVGRETTFEQIVAFALQR